jgi:hypothetical protein
MFPANPYTVSVGIATTSSAFNNVAALDMSLEIILINLNRLQYYFKKMND